MLKLLAKKIFRKIKWKVGKAREYKHKVIRSLSQKKYRVVSFKQWCETNNSPLTIIKVEKNVTISQPVFFSSTVYKAPFQTTQAELPDVYLANIKNATVIDGSDMVISDKNTVLYDEMALDPEGKHRPRMNIAQTVVSRNLNPARIGIVYKKTKLVLPSNSAIHFCKDYSANYFHWLIEALPRLSIVEQFPELDAVPILVDHNLQSQQIESLRLINNNKREIIQLQTGQAYHVENLYYPSGMSHLHNNYDHPVAYGKDIVISPDAIHYLRKKILPLVDVKPAHRKLYISRKNMGAGKRMLNDDEIGTHFAAKGFEIVHPEKLNFIEQVKIFSEAEVIIGAGGAAFANMVFAPKACRVFALNANNSRINYSLFSMMADFIGMKFAYVLGQDKSCNPTTQSHNDYVVDIKLIESALNAS